MPVKKPSPADLEPIERAPRAELQALQQAEAKSAEGVVRPSLRK